MCQGGALFVDVDVEDSAVPDRLYFATLAATS